MNNRRMRFVPGFVLAGMALVTALSSGGCSAASSVTGAAEGCNGLDVNSQAQATVKAWVDAVGSLDVAAGKVEAKWLAVCNEINADMGLDTSKTTAADACGVLNTKIKADLAAGVTITLTVSPPSCEADVGIQANCEASCKASASCDVQAKCTGGDVVVGCNGSCSAACDVTAPSFACMGTCKGECTASAAVQCTGQCTGSCDAPTWSGTCDAGCTANFSGSCGGDCNGKCDGNTMSGGTCAGKCEGSCSAKASGSCMAKCTGNFSGGTCSGMCTGKCNVSAGATCMGECNGTCSYTPGSATCMGECHGSCSAAVTPPTCTGKLDCQASAECHGDCQAKAKADLNCSPPQVTVDIQGDAKLYTSFVTHMADIGLALNQTLALKDLIIGSDGIAAKTGSTFSAIGDIGAAGIACVGAQASVVAHASASINVSVSASATVSGSSS